MHLVIVDTAQIQPYVFGSNRLRENIGASYLVAQATEAWALEAVQAVTTRSNVKADGTLDGTKCIEDRSAALDAEVLYAGGGNFAVLFSDQGGARAFTRKLSRKALIAAPNLQLVVAQESFDWGESLFEKFKATFKKLAQEKRARLLSAPLLGLGVTVMCQSTGLPAQEVVRPIPTDPTSAYPASAEIVAKLEATDAANESLRKTFTATLGDNYAFPRDFDELGRSSGEHSYIAVVHADGNGMGQRIIDLGKAHSTDDKNRDYVSALRGFSDAVEDAAQAALNETLKQLITQVDNHGNIVHKNAGKEIERVELRQESGRWLLPFRPIVFGGDDVTFVCDGRLGMSLAIGYLQAFEQETAKRSECNGEITACAGIAIVKTHYPFARAYTLADELCKSAKTYRRRQRLNGACLDWHFALSGLAGDIEEIREREYTVKAGKLTLRPVTLDENPNESHRVWAVLHKGITAFQGDGWTERHNKVKALRDALREGGAAVEHFRLKFNQTKDNPKGLLPDVEPAQTDWPTTGWQGSYCGYFDAIELADWFIPL